ncbi:SRPBCC domain-containing protein [Arthrobacter sp. CAN_A1]|uniref:SRPBCC domain-containing protein n=1 Tax=Arthrobacter sp. CAN_A1 TaxID=2787717 RepID=UPI0018CB4270
MSDLFSNAAPPPQQFHRVAALEVATALPVTVEHAFAGFTEHIHLWWPADGLSVWGIGSFFDLEDNALVETSADEEEAVWAEVRRTQEDTRLEMIWRHQPGGGAPTELTIDFRPEGGGTTAAIIHSGWTTEPSSVEERAIYRDFWPLALDKFNRFMGGGQ